MSARYSPQTIGERELARTGLSSPEIARRVGAQRMTAFRWRTGARKPSSWFRAQLWIAFGIPEAAWDLLCIAAQGNHLGLEASASSKPSTGQSAEKAA